MKGNVALTKQLLALGADPSVLADRNASVLITALVHGASEELMKLLHARGADPGVPNSDGFGALHALAELRDPLKFLGNS
jgi:ankyrin repeat protein